MSIALGTTRVVILTSRYAIKIARPRVLRPLLQLLRHSVHGEVKKKLQKFHKNPVKGGVKYLTAGIHANLAEWRIYNECKSDALVPTLGTFFGLVNIQVRGEKVQDSDISDHALHPFFEVFPVSENDVFQAKQFCRIHGAVLLADYGRHDLVPALQAYRDYKSPT